MQWEKDLNTGTNFGTNAGTNAGTSQDLSILTAKLFPEVELWFHL